MPLAPATTSGQRAAFDTGDPGCKPDSLKQGNEGDQNYDIPAGTDLTKFHTVAIYCERFNANFGTAPLEK